MIDLSSLYGSDPLVLSRQTTRYSNLTTTFTNQFGSAPTDFFSSPGRTEIGGNHTDHNAGRVLASAIDLDSVAAVSKNSTNTICLYSQGYPQSFIVDLDDLNRQVSETGTTTALIRGIAFRFHELGYRIGGFNASITSDVKIGSGLSSSASIEVLLGTILNHLYNSQKISPETIAQIGQWAENQYFGKPCGLMDQMTCAVGGMVTIDFQESAQPQVKKINFDFTAQNYRLVVVDTGGSHADLTADYASIPAEMKQVAAFFNQVVCRQISFDQIINNLPQLRTQVGDRAILRALHFLGDNDRVVDQVNALESGNFTHFLELVNDSGNSSFMWLQNCFTTQNPREQGISLALAITRHFLHQINAGACRVHGGGFAGTILVFIPKNYLVDYTTLIEKIFGQHSATVLSIRPLGATHL